MTVIARAPVRISFGGGGTDLPAYYERHGGLVVSTTIGYHVYTILSPGPSDEIQIISADHRPASQPAVCEDLIWNRDLRLPKAITNYFNVRDGVTIFLAPQVPPGTGLGSSGSVAVSMIKALAFWCGLDLGSAEVGELACYIEIDKMGMPVGKQDQYAAAFGGLNCITFSRDGVNVEPLHISAPTREALENGLMLFFTGTSSQSSTILRHQQEASQKGDRETIRRLDAIKALAREIQTALQRGDIASFGELLHRSWLEKRQLVEGITNPFLDQCYRTARQHGATGGTVTGAGGGGFLMLYCPEEQQGAVTEALAEAGLQRWPFALERGGVQVMRATSWSQNHAANGIPIVMEGVQLDIG